MVSNFELSDKAGLVNVAAISFGALRDAKELSIGFFNVYSSREKYYEVLIRSLNLRLGGSVHVFTFLLYMVTFTSH